MYVPSPPGGSEVVWREKKGPFGKLQNPTINFCSVWWSNLCIHKAIKHLWALWKWMIINNRKHSQESGVETEVSSWTSSTFLDGLTVEWEQERGRNHWRNEDCQRQGKVDVPKQVTEIWSPGFFIFFFEIFCFLWPVFTHVDLCHGFPHLLFPYLLSPVLSARLLCHIQKVLGNSLFLLGHGELIEVWSGNA